MAPDVDAEESKAKVIRKVKCRIDAMHILE
jgi:hypothetical protein